MRVFHLMPLALAAGVAEAFPNARGMPAYCAAASSNACASAVSSAFSVITDCASFVKSTVMPCSATSTTVVTQVSTVSVKTVTTFASHTWTHRSQATSAVATTTQLNYVPQTVPTTSAQTFTTSDTTTTTITTISTINVPATTVTVTSTVTRAAARRGLNEPRAAACSQQTTVSPSVVPAYAQAACSAPAAYKSACSCLGVTSIVSTWPVQTSLATSTRIMRTVATTTLTETILFDGPTEVSTILATATAQATSTFTVYTTILASSDVTVHATQTAATTSSNTVTDPNLTATATVTVTTSPAATPSSCKIWQVSGTREYYYLYIDNGNDPNAWIMYWAQGARAAPSWYLDANGILTSDSFGVGRQAVAYAGQQSWVYLSGILTPGQGGYYALTCVRNSDSSLGCSTTDGTSINNVFLTNQAAALQFGNASDITGGGYPTTPVTLGFAC